MNHRRLGAIEVRALLPKIQQSSHRGNRDAVEVHNRSQSCYTFSSVEQEILVLKTTGALTVELVERLIQDQSENVESDYCLPILP